MAADVSLVDTETAELFPLAEDMEAEEGTEEAGAVDTKLFIAFVVIFSFLKSSDLSIVDFSVAEINPEEASLFSLFNLSPVR